MNKYYEHNGITFYNSDCLPAMKEMPDNAFDLAIVDPPYGIGMAVWDKKPPPEYFTELFRITENQIIWGANYFVLPDSEAWICWHKTAGFKKRALEGASDFELAWTSFDTKARLFPYTCSGNIAGLNGGRPDYSYKPIHPTQKPVALYKWLLTNYAKPGQTILDTHLGSGSIAIACDVFGFNLTAFEIDKEYIEGATDRLKRHSTQGVLAL